MEDKKKCAYEECEAEATTLARGRDCFEKKGHPGVAMYCDMHAGQVADEGNPEYLECCPNCGCVFGVN